MDRASASKILEAALERPSSTPCTWREDRNAYIAECQAELRACQIDPVPVTAAAGTVAHQHFGYDRVVRKYFAIARSKETWLLYSPETKEFAKAFGTSPENVGLLGPSSPDALAEWLG
jgi:hypothetical protein